MCLPALSSTLLMLGAKRGGCGPSKEQDSRCHKHMPCDDSGVQFLRRGVQSNLILTHTPAA